MALSDLADQSSRRALGSAAQWLGIGVAAVPVIDIADRAGLLVLLIAPETLDLTAVLWPVLQIAFFVGVGVAASALLRRHRPRARGWFFAGCLAPVLIFTLHSGVHGGLRLSSAVALIALCFSLVQLRLARQAAPLA